MQIGKITIIEDASKLDDSIAEVARRGKTLDKLIHRAAVSCMYHAREYGDVRKITALREAMPKSARGKALNLWFETFMPVELDETGKAKMNDNGHYVLAKDRKPEDFYIEEAAAMPFWDLSQEKDPKPVGLDTLMKYLRSMANGGTKARPVSEAAQLAALAALEGIEQAANDDAELGVVVELAKASA